MRLSRSVRVRPPLVLPLVLGGLLPLAVGCQPEPMPTPTPPPVERHVTASQAADLQQQLMTRNPGARVGRVVKVDEPYADAAVDGLSPSEVKPGATVSFMDADTNVVANGTVLSTELASNPVVVVEYKPAPGGRVPRPGDAAVYLPSDAGVR